jgi:hypothetical protein
VKSRKKKSRSASSLVTDDGGSEEKMRTIAIKKPENTQCKKFGSVRGHSLASCSSSVVSCSDFLNMEWKIAYSGTSNVIDAQEMLPAADTDATFSNCEELDLKVGSNLQAIDTVRNALVDEAKRNIRILSIFTGEPLSFMLPYETIEQFRRLIAGFKLTVDHLENV